MSGRFTYMVFSAVRFESAMTSKVVEGPKEGAVSSACRTGKGLMDWVDFILHMAVCLLCVCVPGAQGVLISRRSTSVDSDDLNPY